MPKTDRVSDMTRRALLACAALVAPASVLPAVAAAGGRAPDPHVAWAAELRALEAYLESPGYDALSEEEADNDPAWPRWFELQRLIALPPARTVAGVREQIWYLEFNHRYGPEMGSREEQMLALALATLERLAGEGRA
jgi:hypothetical protein